MLLEVGPRQPERRAHDGLLGGAHEALLLRGHAAHGRGPRLRVQLVAHVLVLVPQLVPAERGTKEQVISFSKWRPKEGSKTTVSCNVPVAPVAAPRAPAPRVAQLDHLQRALALAARRPAQAAGAAARGRRGHRGVVVVAGEAHRARLEHGVHAAVDDAAAPGRARARPAGRGAHDGPVGGRAHEPAAKEKGRWKCCGCGRGNAIVTGR